MKMINVRITERDIEIMQFVNEFGFCEMPQIERLFSIKKPGSYRLLRRLIKIGLMNYQRIYHGRGTYFVTAQGARYTDLPPIEKVSSGQYRHQITIIDVYMKLRQQYPEARWISERSLKHDKFYDGIGKAGHVSDGVLVFPDGRQVAIEVELSLKGQKRIERIFKSYGAQFSIHEVWYFCAESLIAPLRALIERMPFIKIYNVKEFLA